MERTKVLKSFERNNKHLNNKIKKIEAEIDKKNQIRPFLNDEYKMLLKADLEQVNLFEKAFDDLLEMKSMHFKLCSKSDSLFTSAINQMKQSNGHLDQPKNKKMKLNMFGNSFNISNNSNLMCNIELNFSPKTFKSSNSTFNKTFSTCADDLLQSKESILNETITKYSLDKKSTKSSKTANAEPVCKGPRSSESSLNKTITKSKNSDPYSTYLNNLSELSNQTIRRSNQTIAIVKSSIPIKTQSKLKKVKSDPNLTFVKRSNSIRKKSKGLNETFIIEPLIALEQMLDSQLNEVINKINDQTKIANVPNKSSTNQTISNQTTSDQATSDQTTSNQATSNQATSNQATSDQTTSDQATSNQATSNQTAPNDLLGNNLLSASLIIPTPSKYNLRRSVRLMKKNYAY